MTIAGRDCRISAAQTSSPSHVPCVLVWTKFSHWLLVNIKSDVVHLVSEEPPRSFSESASMLSSAFRNTSCSSSTKHSNNPLGTLQQLLSAFL